MPKTLCGFDDTPGGALGRDLLILHGPTLLVMVGFDAGYDVTKPQILPQIPQDTYHALIDTGATNSCIDSAVALALNLPIVDQQVCAGISGPMTVNMHLAQIYAPQLKFTFTGSFAGVDLAAGGQLHSVLIGRSFLRHFKMEYDGDTGTVALDGPIAANTGLV